MKKIGFVGNGDSGKICDLEFSDYSAAARGDQEEMDLTSLFTDVYFIDMEVWVGRGKKISHTKLSRF
ncbi:hypothetical protein HA466_0309370 [Hirschfeldia incana]|nr:hypothetical protein HA466_0309370 [Hirschfeldia incana]